MKRKWIEWIWALPVAILLLSSSSALSKELKKPDCELQRYASVDLSVDQSGFILVPVSVNGRQALMMLNLATSFSVLSLDALDYLRLNTTRFVSFRTLTFGNEQVNQYVRGAELIIGGQARYGSRSFLVSKELDMTPPVQPDALPIIGLLGIGTIGNVDLELDMAAAKLNLYAPSNCADRVVYWSSEYAKVPMIQGAFGEFFFLMELEGKKLQTTLSTSGRTTILYTDASRRLYDFDETSPGTIRESNGEGETTYFRAMALTNDGIKLVDEKIELHRNVMDCGVVRNKANGADGVGYDDCDGVYPLRLGLNTLRKMRIYIATKEKALYITLSEKAQTEAVP